MPTTKQQSQNNSKSTAKSAKASFCLLNQKDKEILSRIFIDEKGDLIVSDMWKEMRELLGKRGDFDA